MKKSKLAVHMLFLAAIGASGCGKNAVEMDADVNTNIAWQSDTLDVNGDGVADHAVVEYRLNQGVYDTLLTVSLDDGTTASVRFKGRTQAREDFITVATGDIFSDGKDGIVIEITNSSSNYASSDIHVLSVEQVDQKLVLTERLSILDGMENSEDYSLYEKSFFSLGVPIVSITSEEELITYLPKEEVNAIKVNGYEEEAGDGIYVYWNGNEWVASEKNEIFKAIEENEAEYSFSVASLEDISLEKPFELGNYYVTNRVTSDNRYYIDEDKVLWGYGKNEYGQLGNGKVDSIDIEYTEPVKIAENVISVDVSGNSYFCIYLTSDGKLYGMGANLSGLLGEASGSDIYDSIDAYEKISTPTLLMENVTYARAGREAIVALGMDGSVWWWGQYRAVSSTQSNDEQRELYWKNEEDESNPVKMLYNSPVKILDHCIYATTGDYTGAAITEKGELYTWGLNIFGECGTEVSERDDYVREPQKVLNQVKMVWPEQIVINSAEKEIPEIAWQTYTYPYNLFVELENGSIMACGEGLGNQTKTIAVTNDIEEETSYCYSAEFVPVILRQYSEKYNREILNQCSFGMTEQEVEDLLEAGGLNYFYSSVADSEDSPSYMVVEDSRYFLYFDDKGELHKVLMQVGGSRDQAFAMGMSLEEVKERG